MRHASLFSGIGGFDLAADWMGWENVFHCDINPFGKKVLEYYYPNSISYGDITKTDFTIHRGDIDILTGGFPCQPYSHAGKRKGKEDERHLWPEMLRAIREIKPRWIIGENVLGLVNWDGGLVFHEVQSDLEAQGYEVFPYVLPACSINAPHRRDRVFFIAYSDKFRCNERNGEYAEQSVNGRLDALNDFGKMSAQESSTDSECVRLEHSTKAGNIRESKGEAQSERSESTESIETDGKRWIASDTESERFESFETRSAEFQSSERQRLYGRGSNGYGNKRNTTDSNCTTNKTRSYRKILGQSDREKTDGFVDVECSNKWENFPTVSPICDGDDGISDRLDSITFSKWRKQSIMAGGNAVVPQLIYVLFKTISKFEQLKSKQ